MHNSIKEAVLEAVDIVDVVAERVTLVRKGRDFVGLCPFHNDHKPSMSVVPKKQIFKCFACGAGGDAIKFVMLSQRVEFRAALEILAKRAGIEMRPASDADRRAATRRDELRAAMIWARTHFRRTFSDPNLGSAARAYAARRGLTDETLDRFGIGATIDDYGVLLNAGLVAGIDRQVLLDAGLIATSEKGRDYDRFRNRLIFPISDAQGRVVAFGGRALGDDPAKYLNSPETALFSKSRILYALDAAREAIEKTRSVVVVEGYMDAVMLHQAGICNVVATLGTALTDAHVKMVAPLADTVFMCFDGDVAGQRAADRAVAVALQHQVDVRVAILPEGVDPDDLVRQSGAEAFNSLLHSAIGALEFKWQAAQKAIGAGGVRAKREALDGFIQFIARAGAARGINEAEQGLIIGRLSEVLAVPARTVYELLAKARTAVRREAYGISPDISELSAYGASIRSLPAGLVAAVEELFGHAIAGGELSGRVGEQLSSAASLCRTWQNLHGLLDSLHREFGEYSREAVLSAVDDADGCELVGSALARVRSSGGEPASIAAVQARLAAELDLMRMTELRETMQGAGAASDDGNDAFRALVSVANRQHAPLGAMHRALATPRRA